MEQIIRIHTQRVMSVSYGMQRTEIEPIYDEYVYIDWLITDYDNYNDYFTRTSTR